MLKYSKIIDPDTGLCEVGTGTNFGFYRSIGMLELDVELSEKDNQWYLSEKCPHYTEEELMQIQKNKRKEEIKKQISELDLKRIRAVCENEMKDEETQETWLEFYNKQIVELRAKLSSL